MGMRAVGSLRLSGVREDRVKCVVELRAALVLVLGGFASAPWRWMAWRSDFALAGKPREDETDGIAEASEGASYVAHGRKSARTDQFGHEFDAFFTRHERPLYGYLRRLLPSDEVAVEIAQETFFRAWSHFETVRVYERPEAWLYRVATNLAISHLRRRQPLSFSHVFARTDAEAVGGEPVDDEVLADPLDVEAQTVERDAIQRALRGLPERQRAALLLRAVQGFTSEEVAEALGVTVPNARQILSRGRERFRRLYDAAQHASDTASEAQG